jgi:hypothetical protein
MEALVKLEVWLHDNDTTTDKNDDAMVPSFECMMIDAWLPTESVCILPIVFINLTHWRVTCDCLVK